ncbi:hypothetical protein [Glycomyces rhizosphaerae]|uniref:DUF998 domain-containing protein n=1 Tax=Glycomyces rhizosphaerae TaxID=2054422 RepID=A0ABV7PZM1_9ACTN
MNGRMRTHLWRRMLIGLATAALYAASALVLAAVFPEGAWPPIGGHGYAAAQAATVPAMNVFGVGIVLIGVFEPIAPVALRHTASAAAALAAAAAAPLMAVLGGTAIGTVWSASGVLALALLGLVLGALRVQASARFALGRSA